MVHHQGHQIRHGHHAHLLCVELSRTSQSLCHADRACEHPGRPPYGDVDDRIRGIAQGLGLRTIMWSHDTNDYNIQPYGAQPTASIQANYQSIEAVGSSPAAATGGIIVLQHELEDAVMSLAIAEYPNIKKNFKSIVPVNTCLNITKPYYEDYTFPDFEDYVAGKIDPSPSGQSSIAIGSTSYTITPLTYAASSSAAGSVGTATAAGGSSSAATSAFSAPTAPGATPVNTAGAAAATVISSQQAGSSSKSSGAPATLVPGFFVAAAALVGVVLCSYPHCPLC